jgi:hypothetical protein
VKMLYMILSYELNTFHATFVLGTMFFSYGVKDLCIIMDV